MMQVFNLSSQSEDLTDLLPSMVKLTAHPDLCVKKACGEILAQHSSKNSEMVLLAINTLVQDCADGNPMVRGLALKTLSSLQQDSVIEHLEPAVKAGLLDKSAYVRRAAVLACIKLHQLSASAVQDGGFVHTLYDMIRDSDPIVVVNCICALDEILMDEGGVVINQKITHYILSKLQMFPTWMQIKILEILKKYKPESEDELFDMMNVMDFCLEHNSPTVMVVCLQLFLHFLEDMPHLQSEVFKRACSSIVGHLGSGNTELMYTLVELVSAAPDSVHHFCDSFQSFFCRNKEPVYLKTAKIRLLPQLVTEDNGHAIMDELALYCVDASSDVSLEAMLALGRILHTKNVFSQDCQTKFISLVQSSTPHVFSNSVKVLQDLDIKDKSFWESLILNICQHSHLISSDASKAALLFLVGEHGKNLSEAVLLLRDHVENFDEIKDRDVKIELLSATVKMFLNHPAECQSFLGQLFERATIDKDREVQYRAVFLYQMLKTSITTAKSVLFSP